MTNKEKVPFQAASLALGQILKYIDKSPVENLGKLVNVSEKLAGGTFPKQNFEKFRKALADPDHVWVNFALSVTGIGVISPASSGVSLPAGAAACLYSRAVRS